MNKLKILSPLRKEFVTVKLKMEEKYQMM